MEGIVKKDLFEVQRMREKLFPYTFTVNWVAGKGHHIADALSRAPHFAPADLDDMYIDTARTCLVLAESNKRGEFTGILDSMDADYIMLRNDILNQTCESRYAGQLKAVFDNLSVDGELVYIDARRIFMPLKGVKPILKLLHISHVGVNKTYDLACSIYYWPGMLNKQMIDGCEACHSSRPSQPVNPRSTEPPSLSLGPPMSHVGIDMFEFGGCQHILPVDQWSCCPMYQKMNSTTSSAVIKVLTGWFNTLRWPNVIRSDGGPQFRSEFVQFWRDRKVSELERVRIHFYAKLESVRIGKGQNWKVSELENVRIGKCQNWKMSELESVRIAKNWKVSEFIKFGKCQNWKVSETAWIGKGQNWNVSETAQIGKCQKLFRLESVRNCSNWKVSETAQIGKCQNWKVSEISQIGMCQKLHRLESVINCSDWKVSETPLIGKCQNYKW